MAEMNGPKPGSFGTSTPKQGVGDYNRPAMRREKAVIRKKAKQASQGFGPIKGFTDIKKMALKTVGWKSPLWLRQQIEQMRAIMEQDRMRFTDTWLELAQFLSPRRPRFLASDVNYGKRRNYAIIDDTAGQCIDVLAAGMLAGLSSPTRQWFQLTTTSPELNEDQAVKDWAYLLTQRMDAVLYKSNLYEELPLMYEDAAVFGTGLIMMEEDDREVVSFKSLPIGSYSIQHDNRGRMNRFYREFMMTAAQMLDQFGTRNDKGEITNWDTFSQAVRSAHDNKTEEYWFYVGHAIRPNHEYEPEAAGTQGMPFLDVYFERGMVNQTAPGVSTSNTGIEQWRFLQIKGRSHWPIMELIWKKTGEDDYGTSCPGVRCIGDVRQLQAQERRIAQATEKMINPPMQGPSSLKGQRVSILAGDITFVDQNTAGQGFRPSHEVNLNVQQAEQRSEGLRDRIRKAWYYDLFMMMQREDPGDSVQPMTAEEVKEKKEEKLLLLSPVLERANRAAFNPLIAFTFNAMLKRGDVPPPPPQAHGSSMEVEYTSIFAQALKLVELQSVERLNQFAQSLAQLFPEALDNLDPDELIKMYADKVGAPPTLIRTEDAVGALRKARAKQQQAQAAQQQAQAQANTAKTLAQAPMGPQDQNALTQMIQNAQGV